MRGIITYFSQVRSELSKVIWPKREEIIKLTLIVIIISIVVGAYVGVLDAVFIKLLAELVS